MQISNWCYHGLGPTGIHIHMNTNYLLPFQKLPCFTPFFCSYNCCKPCCQSKPITRGIELYRRIPGIGGGSSNFTSNRQDELDGIRMIRPLKNLGFNRKIINNDSYLEAESKNENGERHILVCRGEEYKNLNEALVGGGLAVVSSPRRKDAVVEKLKLLQTRAMKEGRGMWNKFCDSNVFRTTSKRGYVFHRKDCHYLKKCRNTESVLASECFQEGWYPCRVCFPDKTKRGGMKKDE